MNEEKTYIADVNKLGCKSVVVQASSKKEALKKLTQEWGEDNIIIAPTEAVSQEQIDSIESQW